MTSPFANRRTWLGEQGPADLSRPRARRPRSIQCRVGCSTSLAKSRIATVPSGPLQCRELSGEYAIKHQPSTMVHPAPGNVLLEVSGWQTARSAPALTASPAPQIAPDTPAA